MDNETFISSVAWIHRGYAARVPLECEADAEDIQDLKRDPMIAEEYPSPLPHRLQQPEHNEMDEELLEE